jgi:hypothetical protein
MLLLLYWSWQHIVNDIYCQDLGASEVSSFVSEVIIMNTDLRHYLVVAPVQSQMLLSHPRHRYLRRHPAIEVVVGYPL